MLSQEADGTVLKIHQGCLDRKTVGKKYDDKLCEVMERAHAHGGQTFYNTCILPPSPFLCVLDVFSGS